MGLDENNKFTEIDETQPIGDIKNPIYPNRYKALSKTQQEELGVAYFKGYFSDNHGNNLGFREFAEKGNIKLGFFDENGVFPQHKSRKNISIEIDTATYKLNMPPETMYFFTPFIGNILREIQLENTVQEIENQINSHFKELLVKELEELENKENLIKGQQKNITIIIKILERKKIKIVPIKKTKNTIKRITEKIIGTPKKS